MDKKYLNLSQEIQTYIEFALSDGKLTSKEIELIKRKAIDFGDDLDELELVLSKIVIDFDKIEKKEFIEVTPKYGFLDSYILAITNYINFKGRASRSEFWFFILFNYLIVAVLFFIVGVQGDEFKKNETNIILLGLFGILFPLFSILPFLSLCSRRLHDVNKPGWFAFIPFYNFFLFCKAGIQGNNKYGIDPYEKLIKEKKSVSNVMGVNVKGNTIEAIGGTMFAIGATSHEAIELGIINFHELDQINKWLWIIGGILIFIPKCYKFIIEKKMTAY